MTLALSPLLLAPELTKLTVAQLRRASHDLIAAADELAERGHHKWSMISGITGSVCIGGAIELVTYRRVGRVHRMYGLFDRTDTDLSGQQYRADLAAAVLAETVRHLCECNDKDEAWGQVAHYNDFHCPGGIVAYNIIRIASARALVLAEHKQAQTKDFASRLEAKA
jgi:hypothetical protein